jgi:hypothetical protein
MPGFFFFAHFVTPGPTQTKLSYALELSMDPFDEQFECFVATNISGASYESAPINFVSTSNGARMALVELRGCDGAEGAGHSLTFRRGNAATGMTYFNWLNVIAL